MATGGGSDARFSIELDGLDELLSNIGSFEKDVRRLVNGQLRRESREIAQAALPLVRRLVAAGPAPQSKKMADTVRAKSDRMPMIVLGRSIRGCPGFVAVRGRRETRGRSRGASRRGRRAVPANRRATSTRSRGGAAAT